MDFTEHTILKVLYNEYIVDESCDCNSLLLERYFSYVTPRDMVDFGLVIKSLLDSIQSHSLNTSDSLMLDCPEGLIALSLLCCDSEPGDRPSAEIASAFLRDMMDACDEPNSGVSAEASNAGASIGYGGSCRVSTERQIPPYEASSESSPGKSEDLRDSSLQDPLTVETSGAEGTGRLSTLHPAGACEAAAVLQNLRENECDCISTLNPSTLESEDSSVNLLGDGLASSLELQCEPIHDPTHMPDKIVNLRERLAKFQSLLESPTM